MKDEQKLQGYFKAEKDGSIRYMTAVTVLYGSFEHGIVHGYDGGGVYDENPIHDGELIPMWDLDGDVYFDMLNEKVGDKEFTNKCWALLEEYVTYDEDAIMYNLNEKGQKLFDATDKDYFFVGDEEFIPIDYGLTSYEQPTR